MISYYYKTNKIISIFVAVILNFKVFAFFPWVYLSILNMFTEIPLHNPLYINGRFSHVSDPQWMQENFGMMKTSQAAF